MPDFNFRINEQPFFDSVRLTTGGGLPTLHEVLVAAFREQLQGRMNELAAAGREVATLDEVMGRVTLRAFSAFAADYLAENRVVETFAVDANVGLLLSNQVRCVVSPGVDVTGTMQESAAVGITTGLGGRAAL